MLRQSESWLRKLVGASAYFVTFLTNWTLVKARRLQEWLAEAWLEVGDNFPEYNSNDTTWDHDFAQDVSSEQRMHADYKGNNDDNDDNDMEELPHSFSKYFRPSVHMYVWHSPWHPTHSFNDRNATTQWYDKHTCLQRNDPQGLGRPTCCSCWSVSRLEAWKWPSNAGQWGCAKHLPCGFDWCLWYIILHVHSMLLMSVLKISLNDWWWLSERMNSPTLL